MRIYLDACALNRLSDDQTQPRVRAEAEAVEQVLRLVIHGQAEWSASIALFREIRRNPDHEKRNDALSLLSHAGALQEAAGQVVQRAEALRELGYGAYDALHLAHAEADHCDVLLTTDDRFMKQARRGMGAPLVRVANPIDWLTEVHGWLPQRWPKKSIR
jgi:predicted nucleic acid-binding protein